MSNVMLRMPLRSYKVSSGAATQELEMAQREYKVICNRSWLEADNADRFQAARERVDMAVELLSLIKVMESASCSRL